jgi:hypothetical protein
MNLASLGPLLARLVTGKKDVADQIEDEEQVLGLKGEKDEDPERGAEEEKDGGMEMQVRNASCDSPPRTGVWACAQCVAIPACCY